MSIQLINLRKGIKGTYAAQFSLLNVCKKLISNHINNWIVPTTRTSQASANAVQRTAYQIQVCCKTWGRGEHLSMSEEVLYDFSAGYTLPPKEKKEKQRKSMNKK
jgi:hypothetical protein